jgi:hypothetical protein
MSAIAFTYLISPFPLVYTGMWPLLAHCAVQLFISYILGKNPCCLFKFVRSLGGRIAFVAEMPAIAIERLFLNRRNRTELKPVEKQEETTKLSSG